jgi:predicted outer membrane repeat protein
MWLRFIHRIKNSSAEIVIMRCYGSVLLCIASHAVSAGGIVGNGTAASCTAAALQNRLSSGGTVTFNCGSQPVTLTLTSPLIVENDSVIDGGNVVSLSGGKTSRLLINRASLSLKNLTLRDAYSNDAYGGAAVVNDYRANLTVSNSKFIANVARISPASGDAGGGAIALHGGTLQIDSTQFLSNVALNGGGGAIHSVLGNIAVKNSFFRNNHAGEPGYAGAIYSDGTLEGAVNGFSILRNNRFVENSGAGQGGAVFLFLYPSQTGSRGLIDSCEFVRNKVVKDFKGDALGGALRLGNGRFTVNKSSFLNNTAEAQGGAIWTGEVSHLNLRNSTFSGNQADLGGAISPQGTGKFYFTNNTIVFNTAAAYGGAIFGGSTNVKLTNNLIAYNKANNPWNINHNCSSWLVSGGGNIQYPKCYYPSDVNDHDCTATGIKMLKPLLGTLAYHDNAKTRMYNLQASSPAIDGGVNKGCTAFDQRNVARPQRLRCDVGAFEAK